MGDVIEFPNAMTNVTHALGYVQLMLEKRQLKPFIDKRVLLVRIARKVERAANRLGSVPAQDTLLALLGERVYYDYVQALANRILVN